MHTVLSSATRTITIGHDQPFCIIGERINPTGRKKFQEQLRAGDYSAIEADVAAQVAGGATMLDVNMGAPLIDEPAAARSRRDDRPGAHRPARCASTRRSSRRSRRASPPTRARRSSTRSPPRRSGWTSILPLVPQVRRGDHRPAQRRVRDPRGARASGSSCTKVIVDYATTKYEIPIEDIVIDPLAMTVGADSEHGRPHARDDPPHQRAGRRQHDARCVERVLRHARPAHPELRSSCRWRWPPA